jgi:hypothetical protein
MANQRILDATRTMHRYGLHTSAFVMFGLPTETREEVLETLRLCAEVELGRFRWALFFPFPGTAGSRIAQERGLIDHEREAMLKSDHVPAISSHEHYAALCAEAGLEVAERRYYNVVFKAVVEDLLLRLFEQWRRRRRGETADAHDHPAHLQTGPPEPGSPGATPAASGETARATSAAANDPAPLGASAAEDVAPTPPKPRSVGAPPPPKPLLWVAMALTWLLKLDVVLFSGIRTGPFFALLRPRRSPLLRPRRSTVLRPQSDGRP